MISSGRPGIFNIRGDPGSTVSVDTWAGGDAVVRKISKAPAAPSQLYAFERDDDQFKLVVAYGGSMLAFDTGDPESTS